MTTNVHTQKNTSTIHVHRFTSGNQGACYHIGTIERSVVESRCFGPGAWRGCASRVMEWKTIRSVSIAGVRYALREASGDFGTEKKGELIVDLDSADALPRDLNHSTARK